MDNQQNSEMNLSIIEFIYIEIFKYFAAKKLHYKHFLWRNERCFITFSFQSHYNSKTFRTFVPVNVITTQYELLTNGTTGTAERPE